MIKRHKRWSGMTTTEFREATKEFDDPNFDPPALKPTRREAAQLRRLQRKAATSSYRTLKLDKKTAQETDSYAAEHGLTFTQPVKTALRELIRKKSA